MTILLRNIAVVLASKVKGTSIGTAFIAYIRSNYPKIFHCLKRTLTTPEESFNPSVIDETYEKAFSCQLRAKINYYKIGGA